MKVLQNGHVLARLSSVRRRKERISAIWDGPPPPFGPTGQLEPFLLESDDGLDRREVWLCEVGAPAHEGGPVRVELGPERCAPPWHKSEADEDLNGGEQSEKTRLAACDVLVVDDDRDTVELVAQALEDEGYAVRRAFSGREALVKAREKAPQVAVIDLIMPEISGEEVCAALRRDPFFAGTRVLVLSGAEDTRSVAAACDADSAVIKPFTTELLVHEVRRLTGQ